MNIQSKKNNSVKTQVFSINNEKVVLPVIEGTKDVFISYKRENAQYVSRLCDEFESHDIKTWFDWTRTL